MKPLAFLDIDGVLNRDVLPPEPMRSRDGLFASSAMCGGMDFHLVLSRLDRARIECLALDFDLAWGTTWEDDAWRVTDKIGVDARSWPVAEVIGQHKAPGVLRVADGRPFVWFDDALTDERPILDAAGATWLGVDVDSRSGLSDEHIETALNWARRLNGGQA